MAPNPQRIKANENDLLCYDGYHQDLHQIPTKIFGYETKKIGSKSTTESYS